MAEGIEFPSLSGRVQNQGFLVLGTHLFVKRYLASKRQRSDLFGDFIDLFEHRYIHSLAKLATAEGIEFPSLSGRVRNLTAAFIFLLKCSETNFTVFHWQYMRYFSTVFF